MLFVVSYQQIPKNFLITYVAMMYGSCYHSYWHYYLNDCVFYYCQHVSRCLLEFTNHWEFLSEKTLDIYFRTVIFL